MTEAELKKISEKYIEHHRARAERELEYFLILRSDEEAVSQAALSQIPSGKRHPHQYRVPRAALEESCKRLLPNLPLLRKSKSFDELFEHIEQLSGSVPGIGELAVYDTALRVGARFHLAPTKVYLHAGTRKGARAIGVDPRRRTMKMDELPPPLRVLTAREVEDALCIYKGGLPDPPSNCADRVEAVFCTRSKGPLKP